MCMPGPRPLNLNPDHCAGGSVDPRSWADGDHGVITVVPGANGYSRGMSRFPDVPVTDLPDDAVFLDIREQHEWDAGHAPNAVHIPLGELSQNLDHIRDLAGDRQLIVTCKGGGRVRRTLPSLAEFGLDVANLEGGMKAWHEAGKPMVSSDGSEPTVA